MTERTIMTEKTRLRPGELTAPKTNFAMKDACITGDENNGNNMRKIERGPDASASLDDHFPHARSVGLEVRHSSDATR